MAKQTQYKVNIEAYREWDTKSVLASLIKKDTLVYMVGKPGVTINGNGYGERKVKIRKVGHKEIFGTIPVRFLMAYDPAAPVIDAPIADVTPEPAPDATEAAPVPRYYVDNAGQLHFIRDREHLNEEGKHRIVEAMFTRVAADVKVNELNTANTAPIEAPQHPVLTALKALNVDEMSPLEALTKLGELQRMLGQE